jgi:hypothetical protein
MDAHKLVMAGLVPAMTCHSRESGNPVTTGLSCLSRPGLLDCPVKPGNDIEILKLESHGR